MGDLDLGSSGVDDLSCATEDLRCSRIYGRPDIGPWGRRSDRRANGIIYLPPLPFLEAEKRDKDRPLSPRPCYVYQPRIPITPSGPESAALQIDYFAPMPKSDLRFPPPVSDTAYRQYDVFEDDGYHGYGTGFYFAPDKDAVQRCAADAMRLHKEEGVNLVRITDLPEENSEPFQLYKLFKKFGCVTHVITFHDQGLGFVGFVSENAAKTASRNLNSSGYGHVNLATDSPQP